MGDVSVIIVSYHTGPSLDLCLDAVLAEESVSEVILVDNGNPEADRAKLDLRAGVEPRLKMLRGHGNVGFARGCNLGVMQAVSDYILLLNPDCVISPGSIATIHAHFKADPKAMLAGCRIIDCSGKEQKANRRNLLTPMNLLYEGSKLSMVSPVAFPPLNLSHCPPEKDLCNVPAISGAFMLMKRERYIKLGGMDENYPLHVEDLDLCRRVHMAGGDVLYFSTIDALHIGSTSRASPLVVEWKKCLGFFRYFQKFCAEGYPRWQVRLAKLMVMLRFAVMALLMPIRKFWYVSEPTPLLKRLVALRRARHLPGSGKMRGRTIAVFGATSQAGLAIVGRFLGEGALVTGYSRSDQEWLRAPGLSWKEVDLEAPIPTDLLGEIGALVHAAPIWLLPAQLPAIKGVKRLIAISSASVHSKKDSPDDAERQLAEKLRLAETETLAFCKAHGIDLTIFRPTMLYGFGLDENIGRIARFIRRFHFFPIYPTARGLRMPLHVLDLAEAVIASMDNAATYQTFYDLGGKETLRYKHMIGRICDALSHPHLLISSRLLPWIAQMLAKVNPDLNIRTTQLKRQNQNLTVDNHAAEDDFGFNPRAFLTGGKEDLGL